MEFLGNGFNLWVLIKWHPFWYLNTLLRIFWHQLVRLRKTGGHLKPFLLSSFDWVHLRNVEPRSHFFAFSPHSPVLVAPSLHFFFNFQPLSRPRLACLARSDQSTRGKMERKTEKKYDKKYEERNEKKIKKTTTEIFFMNTFDWEKWKGLLSCFSWFG